MNAKKHFLILGLVGALVIPIYGHGAAAGDGAFPEYLTTNACIVMHTEGIKAVITDLTDQAGQVTPKQGCPDMPFDGYEAKCVASKQALWCQVNYPDSQGLKMKCILSSSNVPLFDCILLEWICLNEEGKLNCYKKRAIALPANTAQILTTMGEVSVDSLGGASLVQDIGGSLNPIKDFDGDGISDDDDNCPEQYDPTNACGEHGDICDPEVDVSCSEAVPPGGGGCSLMGGDHSHSLSLSWAVAIGLALLLVVRRRSESDYS